MSIGGILAQGLRRYRWRILLGSLLGLLAISPISDVYNRADNFISPLIALVVMAVTLCTGLGWVGRWSMALLTSIWLIVAIATDGSGIFAGVSFVAPVMFLAIMAIVFVLLARWLAQATVVNSEVLGAAMCGYLMLGIFWAGLYALIEGIDSRAIVSSYQPRMEHSDLIYFSYSTLTTSGFGDLIPRNSAARMWSVMEAVVGTFYNAIVIARFVTLYGVKGEGVRPES